MPAPQLLFLVEDEELVQVMLHDAFTDAGFEVFTAGNGTKALAELGRRLVQCTCDRCPAWRWA
jgi:DNA-binding response OmpR family regulator